MDELTRLVEAATGDLSALTNEPADESGIFPEGSIGRLRADLAAAYEEAREGVDEATVTEDEVEALRQVVAAIQRVDGEVTTREAAAEGTRADLAALDAQVAGEPEGEGDATTEGEAEGADTEGEGDGDAATADTEGGDAAGAGEGEGTGNQATEGDAAQIAASARPAGRAPSLAVLARARERGRGRAVAQQDEDDPGRLPDRFVAAAGLPDVAAGNPFGTREVLGRQLQSLHAALQVEEPSRRRHVVGRIGIRDSARLVRQDDPEFSGVDGEGLIAEAVRRNIAYRMNLMNEVAAGRLVASGGICVPAQPDYSVEVVGDRGTPFVETLPTVVGTRPTSYYPWIETDLNAAAGSGLGARPESGIGIVTAAQDEAGYGGTHPTTGVVTAVPTGGANFKDFADIDCPEMVTCTPEAVFKGTRVGRFAAITWPEYVNVFEERIGMWFDVRRDERGIERALTGARVVTATPNMFGTSRDLLTRLRRLMAHNRSARRAPGQVWHWYLPSFAATMLANDLAVSYTGQPLEALRITPAQALAALAAEEGMMIDTYDVSAGTTSGGSPTVLPLQAAGALNEWPEELRVFGWPEGAVFHQTYGQVAFGLVETLFATNDFAGFEEVFEQTCSRSGDRYVLDIATCESGATGAPIAVTCGGLGETSGPAEAPVPAAPPGANEVQQVTVGDATGGTFTLDFDGEVTAAIAFNASDATMLARLEALSNIAVGDVEVVKDVPTATWTIQFTGNLAGENVPTLVADDTLLTGGASTATVSVLIAGG